MRTRNGSQLSVKRALGRIGKKMFRMKPVKKIVRAMLTKYLKASLKWKKSMTT
jgi:hypothetical protein